MGFSYAWAKANLPPHIAAQHPAVAGKSSLEKQLLDSIHAGPPRESQAPQDGMSKLERDFRDNVLEPALYRGDIVAYWREPIKLRLAGRCWYSPDFLVLPNMGHLIAIEVKGPFAREDSIIKLKVAAETYECFSWLFIRREERHQWLVRRVTRGGIGREPVSIHWINGEA